MSTQRLKKPWRGLFWGRRRIIDKLDLAYEKQEGRILELASAYQCLADLTSDFCLMLDPISACVIEGDERAARLLGLTLEELPGTSSKVLFDGREQGRWARLLSRVQEGNVVNAESLMLASADGKKQWVDVRLANVMNQSRPCLMMVMHDATEQQKQYTLSQKQISFVHEMSSSLPRFRSFEEVLNRLASSLSATLEIHAFSAILPDEAAGAAGYVYVGRDTSLPFINQVKQNMSAIAGEMSEKSGKSMTSFTISRHDEFSATSDELPMSQIMLPMAGTDGVAGIFSSVADAFRKEDLSIFSTTLNTLSALYLAFQAYQEVERLSVTDSLTCLYNRRKFFEELIREWERARRYGSRLSLIMLDLDHFKDVNDNYGHQVGDEVLRATSEVLTASTRKTDVVARYGGEEFIVMLTETGPEGALEVAERIRRSMAKAQVSRARPDLRCTASLGVTTFRSTVAVDKLVNEADEALYSAKHLGRDKVVLCEALAHAVGGKSHLG